MSERDTLPPDFRAMDAEQRIVYLCDSMFELIQAQREQGEALKATQAELTLLTQHVEMIGNQLVTGDEDPRTVAQRLQSAENGVNFLVAAHEQLNARQIDHELADVSSAHPNPTFHDLHDAEKQRRAVR